MKIFASDFKSLTEFCNFIADVRCDTPREIIVSNLGEKQFLLVSIAKFFNGYHNDCNLIWSDRTKNNDHDKFDFIIKIKDGVPTLKWEFNFDEKNIVVIKEIGDKKYYVLTSGVFNVWLIYNDVNDKYPKIVYNNNYSDVLNNV